MSILDCYTKTKDVPTILPGAMNGEGPSPLFGRVMRIVLTAIGFGPVVAALAVLGEHNLILQVLGAAFTFVGNVLPALAWMHIFFVV